MKDSVHSTLRVIAGPKYWNARAVMKRRQIERERPCTTCGQHRTTACVYSLCPKRERA